MLNQRNMVIKMKTTSLLLDLFICMSLTLCSCSKEPSTPADTTEQLITTQVETYETTIFFGADLAGKREATEEFVKLNGSLPNSSCSDDKCYEITPDGYNEKYGIRIFKFEKSFESYLLYDGILHRLGESFGGFGVNSIVVSDVDSDGNPELYCAYSWGSGIHSCRIGQFDFEDQTFTTLEYVNYVRDFYLIEAGEGIVELYEYRIGEPISPSEDNTLIGTLEFEKGKVSVDRAD